MTASFLDKVVLKLCQQIDNRLMRKESQQIPDLDADVFQLADRDVLPVLGSCEFLQLVLSCGNDGDSGDGEQHAADGYHIVDGFRIVLLPDDFRQLHIEDPEIEIC